MSQLLKSKNIIIMAHQGGLVKELLAYLLNKVLILHLRIFLLKKKKVRARIRKIGTKVKAYNSDASSFEAA